jgi:hypothetical protein
MDGIEKATKSKGRKEYFISAHLLYSNELREGKLEGKKRRSCENLLKLTTFMFSKITEYKISNCCCKFETNKNR